MTEKSTSSMLLAPVIPDETWSNKLPQKGDHIRVKRVGGLFYHHGIYISDEEIINFSGENGDNILIWSRAVILSSDLSRFLKNGTPEVREYTEEELLYLYPVEHIIENARACLGTKGYHLIFNNCEHFINYCTLGYNRSNQIDRILSGGLPNNKNQMSIFSKLGGLFRNLRRNKKTGHFEK